MTIEVFDSKLDLELMATGLVATFFQRQDLYAQQLGDGSYICIRKPLETSHLIAHLTGKITLGTYVLDLSSQTRFIVFDADDESQFEQAVCLSNDLSKEGVPSYLEESRRGGHLWLFFCNPISGKDARLFARQIAGKRYLKDVEVFPKQDKLISGPGSLIRLPFGIHRKTGLRYDFITPEHHALARSFLEQCKILTAPETVPEEYIKSKMTGSSSQHKKPVLEGIEQPTMPLSERVKSSIGIYEFISQYVELSPAGRGRCPFHDDQHASFSVNIEGNYWHCFSGCGGGSIIDFWMKRQGCDFIEAVRDLAELLLVHPQNATEPGDDPSPFHSWTDIK